MNNVVEIPQLKAAQTYLENMVLTVAESYLMICGFKGEETIQLFHDVISVPEDDGPLEITDHNPENMGELLQAMVELMPMILRD